MRHSGEEKSIFWADSPGPVRVPEPLTASVFLLRLRGHAHDKSSASTMGCRAGSLPIGGGSHLHEVTPGTQGAPPTNPQPHRRCPRPCTFSAGEEFKAAVKPHILSGWETHQAWAGHEGLLPKFTRFLGRARGGLNQKVPRRPKNQQRRDRHTGRKPDFAEQRCPPWGHRLGTPGLTQGWCNRKGCVSPSPM